MTLAIAILGRKSIWISADRRLTAADGRTIADDAIKVSRLERPDGEALLAYAGLGRTAKGTQPSQWMNSVLRGRAEGLERSLEILGKAILAQMPEHLMEFKHPGKNCHVFLAPAFFHRKPILYTLALDIDVNGNQHKMSAQRHLVREGSNRQGTRIAVAGSGTAFVLRHRRAQLIGLFRLVAKHEHGRISPWTVADSFAKLNFETSKNVETVGPGCIVAWHYVRDGSAPKFSPSSQAYSGLERDRRGASIPINANGIDMTAFFDTLAPFLKDHFARMRAGLEPLDHKEAKERAVNKLPRDPDEKLR